MSNMRYVAENLRGFVESMSERGRITPSVAHDLLTIAGEVDVVEKEFAERHVVTSEEHMRVVNLYGDMLAGEHSRNYELDEQNDRLKQTMADMYRCIESRKNKGTICWKCPHHRKADELRHVCFLADDLRELGVDTDG